MSMFYLKVTKKGVQISFYDGKHHSKKIVRSVAGIRQYLARGIKKHGTYPCMQASSVNWPEDVTTDKKILKLCEEIWRS